MNASLVLACLWVITASVTAMVPSRRHHWPAAYVLIALGLPLLAFLAWQNGPWIALAALAAGASILRWPVRYLFRWLKRQIARGD